MKFRKLLKKIVKRIVHLKNYDSIQEESGPRLAILSTFNKIREKIFLNENIKCRIFTFTDIENSFPKLVLK